MDRIGIYDAKVKFSQLIEEGRRRGIRPRAHSGTLRGCS